MLSIWKHVYEDTFSMMKQAKSNGRQETGWYSPSCTTNTGIDEGTIVSEMLRPQVSYS